MEKERRKDFLDFGALDTVLVAQYHSDGERGKEVHNLLVCDLSFCPVCLKFLGEFVIRRTSVLERSFEVCYSHHLCGISSRELAYRARKYTWRSGDPMSPEAVHLDFISALTRLLRESSWKELPLYYLSYFEKRVGTVFARPFVSKDGSNIFSRAELSIRFSFQNFPDEMTEEERRSPLSPLIVADEVKNIIEAQQAVR